LFLLLSHKTENIIFPPRTFLGRVYRTLESIGPWTNCGLERAFWKTSWQKV